MSEFNHGGSRPGAGRPKGVGSKSIRVPSPLVDYVEWLVISYKANPDNFTHLFSMMTNPMSPLHVASLDLNPVLKSKYTKKPASRRKKKK